MIGVVPVPVKLLRGGFSRIELFLKLGFVFVLQLLALDWFLTKVSVFEELLRCLWLVFVSYTAEKKRKTYLSCSFNSNIWEE